MKNKKHREAVGGMWDEIGNLQIGFLVSKGLEPRHKLLDIGCGCLRGGVHFIKYLNRGNYYGIDKNADLIKAGEGELKDARLVKKRPRLLVGAGFDFSQFKAKFDFMISVSLFPHMQKKEIGVCLSSARKYLKPGGVYFSSYFQAPDETKENKIIRMEGIVTSKYADPYHYSDVEMEQAAFSGGFRSFKAYEWGHPRGQVMGEFGN